MKILSLAALSSLAATLVIAKCPIESECIQKSCTGFEMTDKVLGRLGASMYRTVSATCEDLHGNKVFSYLHVDNCITNNKGKMYFSYMGDFGCNDCQIKPRNDNEDVKMECKCRGNDDRGEINLSEGLWFYNGRLGCYREEGKMVPISAKNKENKKRSNELNGYSFPYPVGQTLDDAPAFVKKRTVSLPFPVGQTLDDIPHPMEQAGDGSNHGPSTHPRDTEMPFEKSSENPRAVEFPRGDNAPPDNGDSQEEPARDDGNGRRSDEGHMEYVSKRGRSFRHF